MEKIEQALWGYSNGHRLLAASIGLSITSHRLLETLSDLSGNDTSENFNGYYTGCWLPDDNYYAISKTWYATEMPRSGCAWTHTLFFDSKAFSTTIKIPIDTLFKRPNINDKDFLSYYKITKQIDEVDGNNYLNSYNSLWLLQTIISKKRNIVICYDNVLDFNLLFESLFKIMGVAFFKNFSFCTGSQTNRMINDKSLNIQIMPTNISKVALRLLSTVVPFEKSIDNLSGFYITNFDELLKVKQYALQIDKGCYSFDTFLSIQEIYNYIHRAKSVDLPSLISITQKAFSYDQSIKIFSRVLDVFIRDTTTNMNDSLLLIDLFLSISTTDERYNSFIGSLDVSNFINYIYELRNKDRSSILRLISKLLVSELNEFGEKFLKELAFAIDSNDLVQLLSEMQTHGTVLLQSNWKLAKNKVLWKMPLETQYEMIKNISYSFKSSTYEDIASFSELLFIIFENSSDEVSDELFEVFGDFSITTYFEWIENSNYNKSIWIRICRNNSSKSISLLKYTPNANPELFYSLIKIIDPWDKSMLTVETDTWEKLYYNYCKSNSNNKLNDLFAKFMLQVMINTNTRLSDSFAYFVFMRVHKLLEAQEFDNIFWNKVASYLPEVKWYNSWDAELKS